jgi:hypothetical protein
MARTYGHPRESANIFWTCSSHSNGDIAGGPSTMYRCASGTWGGGVYQSGTGGGRFGSVVGGSEGFTSGTGGGSGSVTRTSCGVEGGDVGSDPVAMNVLARALRGRSRATVAPVVIARPARIRRFMLPW